MSKTIQHPNLTENPEFVLYNRHEDKILPKIYDFRSEARKDSRLHKGYSVVDVQDLPDHQQDFLIKEYNQNLKYIK